MPTTVPPQSKSVRGSIIYLLVTVIIVQFLYPFTVSESIVPLLLYQVVYISLFGAGILLVRENKPLMIALVAVSVAWYVAGLVYAFNQTWFWANIIGYALIFLFQAAIVYILLQYIFSIKVVNREVLYAASTVYIMLGALFVAIFGGLETIAWFSDVPHHVIVDSLADPTQPLRFQSLIYFSYTNLTTLGYGDVLPQTAWARSIATFEAVVGVLYLAIIMARLVGLYANEESVTELEA